VIGGEEGTVIGVTAKAQERRCAGKIAPKSRILFRQSGEEANGTKGVKGKRLDMTGKKKNNCFVLSRRDEDEFLGGRH